MTRFATFARCLVLAGTGLALVTGSVARAEDASVAQRLSERGMKFEIDGDGDYKVTYNYKKEGRTQLVFVAGRTYEVADWVIREVFSPGARIEQDGIGGAKALELLRHSSTNKFGSWEIRGDVLYFVIKLPEPISAERLEAAMDIVAQSADDMELTISGSRDAL